MTHQIPMSVYAPIVARAMSAADLPDDDRVKIMAAAALHPSFSINFKNCPLTRAGLYSGGDLEFWSTRRGWFITEHDAQVAEYLSRIIHHNDVIEVTV